MPARTALEAQREATVREHMESENRLDLDTTMATFARPRYEIIATGQVYDGAAAVRAYFASSRASFPDQRNELVSLRHAEDAVIVEFDLLGTQRGELLGFPPSGRELCERVYFDALTILGQLGHGPT